MAILYGLTGFYSRTNGCRLHLEITLTVRRRLLFLYYLRLYVMLIKSLYCKFTSKIKRLYTQPATLIWGLWIHIKKLSWFEHIAWRRAMLNFQYWGPLQMALFIRTDDTLKWDSLTTNHFYTFTNYKCVFLSIKTHVKRDINMLYSLVCIQKPQYRQASNTLPALIYITLYARLYRYKCNDSLFGPLRRYVLALVKRATTFKIRPLQSAPWLRSVRNVFYKFIT